MFPSTGLIVGRRILLSSSSVSSPSASLDVFVRRLHKSSSSSSQRMTTKTMTKEDDDPPSEVGNNKIFRSSHPSSSPDEGRGTISTSFSQQVKPFHKIPGPRPLPVIGNLWRYLPVVGEYDMERLDKIGLTNVTRYGPIVRENLYGNLNIVHLFDPNDMEVMFRHEGRYPERRSHRALGQYRKERSDLYSSGGIFCENGPEWYRLRKISQTSLMSTENVASYVGVTQEVTNELIDFIRSTRDNQLEMSDFEYDLYKWSLENITQVTMDTRFGCLRPNLPKDSEAAKIIRAAHEVIEGIHNTELGTSDLWRYFPTKYYRQLCRGEDQMAEIVSKYLKKKLEEVNIGKNDPNGPKDTILGQFFKSKDANFGDILSTVLDLMLAGIDTTAFSAGFVIYYLAKNPDRQEVLRQEIRSVFPDRKSNIKPESLASGLPYLKACVKESMRLTPLSVGVGRVTTQDTVIRGYNIPPGVMVITQNQVACRLAGYFESPDDFIPERWLNLREKKKKEVDATSGSNNPFKKPHPFLSLPFGFGPRSCPGRRLSDMNTYVLLIELLRNFRIEYHYEDISVRTRLINIPDRPMRFRFVDIDQ